VNNPKPVIGILGAGKLGTVLAQLFIKAGYQVYIAGSGDASKIALSVKVITPGALAVTVDVAIAQAHIVILALFDDTRPVGANDRKVIAIAGDNTSDNQLVSKLIDDLGFDPIIIGELSAGKFLEPGSSMFGASVTDKEVHNLLPLARSN
jgi:predicted dinucleotide-binding enzyme